MKLKREALISHRRKGQALLLAPASRDPQVVCKANKGFIMATQPDPPPDRDEPLSPPETPPMAPEPGPATPPAETPPLAPDTDVPEIAPPETPSEF